MGRRRRRAEPRQRKWSASWAIARCLRTRARCCVHLPTLDCAVVAAACPLTPLQMVDKELKRLRRMDPMFAEYQVLLTYLETLADMPWDRRVGMAIDVDRAKVNDVPQPSHRARARLSAPSACRRCWKRTTTAWTRSSGVLWSTWPCAHCRCVP